MFAALIVTLAALPPPVRPAADGGLVAGIGGATWRVLPKHSDDAGHGPVAISTDGGRIIVAGLRQGCGASGGCTFAAPGVFLPSFRTDGPLGVRVRLETVSLDDFDVRLGFVEGLADGGVACEGLSASGAPDLYNADWGCDGLELHVTMGPTGSQVAHVNLVPEGSQREEPQRANLLSRLQGSPMHPRPTPLTVSWSLARADAGWVVALDEPGDSRSIFFSDAELRAAPNGDAQPFSGGELDLGRAVPVLFIGWGTFLTADDVGSMELSLEGHGLDVTAVRGAPSWEIDLVSVDQAGAPVFRTDAIATSVDGAPVPLALTLRDGGAHLSYLGAMTRPAHVEFVSQTDPWLRGDVWLVPDAGEAPDQVDAGPPGPVRLTVGCGCDSAGAIALALAALPVLSRLRRREARPSPGAR